VLLLPKLSSSTSCVPAGQTSAMHVDARPSFAGFGAREPLAVEAALEAAVEPQQVAVEHQQVAVEHQQVAVEHQQAVVEHQHQQVAVEHQLVLAPSRPQQQSGTQLAFIIVIIIT
jgi:hypothetical protein